MTKKEERVQELLIGQGAGDKKKVMQEEGERKRKEGVKEDSRPFFRNSSEKKKVA